MKGQTLAENIIDRFGYDAWFQCVVWPLAVCEVSLIISRLKSEIRRTGGQRQRSEGIKLLDRIYRRQREQIQAHGERIKANQMGWEV